jgi:hypothetical protein
MPNVQGKRVFASRRKTPPIIDPYNICILNTSFTASFATNAPPGMRLHAAHVGIALHRRHHASLDSSALNVRYIVYYCVCMHRHAQCTSFACIFAHPNKARLQRMHRE